MRIGELAQNVGISTDTIRFYEKKGLLDDSLYRRGENNYRYYDAAAIERLTLITKARRLGFTLSEILEIGTLWASGKLRTKDKVRILEEKLEELEKKKQEITELQTSIEAKMKSLQEIT